MGGKLKPRLSEHSGKVLNWTKEPFGLSGTAEKARFRITLYGESIIRVQLTRDDFFEDFSYSVIASPVGPGGHSKRFAIRGEPCGVDVI